MWRHQTDSALLSNASATGNPVSWVGGNGVFKAVAGAWNGGTVMLQYRGPDGTTWVEAGSNTTLTANGGGQFVLPAGLIRAAVSGGPTGVYASAEPGEQF